MNTTRQIATEHCSSAMSFRGYAVPRHIARHAGWLCIGALCVVLIAEYGARLLLDSAPERHVIEAWLVTNSLVRAHVGIINATKYVRRGSSVADTAGQRSGIFHYYVQGDIGARHVYVRWHGITGTVEHSVVSHIEATPSEQSQVR